MGLNTVGYMRIAAVLIVLAATACSDAAAPREAELTETPFVISTSQGALTGSYSVTGSNVVTFTQRSFAYIALPSGSIPGADSVTILVQSTGVVVKAGAVDGGVDPVAVPADVGDELSITVSKADGSAPLHYNVVVPKRARPVIIRTEPPANKRDVPLNSVILVEFSEPIDSASLTPAAITLSAASSVAAHLSFGDSQHLSVVLTPDQPLAYQSLYTLTIGQTIRNLDGDVLRNTTSIQFTTVNPPVQVGQPFPPGPGPNPYHVAGIVTDDAGTPLPGARVELDYAPSTYPPQPVIQLQILTDADGKFSTDVLAMPFRNDQMPMSAAFGMILTLGPADLSYQQPMTYDLDYRYLEPAQASDLHIQLHRSRQINPGDSLEVTIVTGDVSKPTDAICLNNATDMHPWPTETVCRTFYVMPNADGLLTIWAGTCQVACSPVGIEAESIDWRTLEWVNYPAGTLQIAVTNGLPVRVDVNVPWSSGYASQTFMLHTSLAPPP